jgi:hypothetical protein
MQFYWTRSLVAFGLFLAACDGGEETDAGVDAGAMDAGQDEDAGVDAGPFDAGVDAGPFDGGPLPPSMTGPLVETELTEATTLVGAIPMQERIDEGAFVTVDLATSGIDALVGEEGLDTLSLTDPAVRAWADLRMCGVLVTLLDRSISTLSDLPAYATLSSQLTSLRGRLVDHCDAVARLYVERRDLGVPGTTSDFDSFTEDQRVYGVGGTARLAFAAEALQAPTAFNQLTVGCESLTAPMLEARVIDATTGAHMGSGGPAADTVSLSVDNTLLAVDVTSLLDVQVDGIAPIDGTFRYCTASLSTRRRLRTAPLDPMVASNYFGAITNVESSLASVGFALYSAETELGTAAAEVLVHVQIMMDLVGALMSGSLRIPLETLERIEREQMYVELMTLALLASPAMNDSTDTTVSEVGGAVRELATTIDALIAEVRSVAP